MKTTESIVWVALFWGLYAPTALILHLMGSRGTLAGIFVIGGVLSLILGVFTKTQNGILFEEVTKLEVYDYDEKQEEESRPSALAEGGFEPGQPMHTDVNLGMLNADDDDLSS